MKITHKILAIAVMLCVLPILCLAEGETPISPIKSGANAESETPTPPIASGANAEGEPEELKVIATETPAQEPAPEAVANQQESTPQPVATQETVQSQEQLTPQSASVPETVASQQGLTPQPEPTPETVQETIQNQEPLAVTPVSLEQVALLAETQYTLGPDDIIEILVLRHPEFSGTFPVNKEGKIQYKFVGDMDVNGLTKQALEEKIKQAISTYVISPEINITITEYRSKVFYVLGEVGSPGKYYMRAEKLPVREAIFQAGLPTYSASMRKCRIISPDDSGRAKVRRVDLYSLLYGGDLRKDINLFPGDVLYVPATVMAKVIRVINPIASTVGIASGTPQDISTGREATKALVK